MHSALIFLTLILNLILISGCNQKTSLPKNHLKHVTLKLEKPISIKLKKVGKSLSSFNILAEVSNSTPILEANINWIVVDENNQKILNLKSNYSGSKKELSFDSGNIELPTPDQNYKIIFIFSGKTSSEEINKTEVYNSLIQDEINSALSDLQDRANN
jgi:hypothetical protein